MSRFPQSREHAGVGVARGVVGRLLAAMLILVAPAASWSACSVSARGLNFGNYDPLGRSGLDGAGGVDVACDAGVAYTIALSSGNGTYADRIMANGAYALRYNLFTDAARILVWGDGSGSTTTVSGMGTAAGPASATIYGRIPAAQNAHVGNYFDTVIVTVTF